MSRHILKFCTKATGIVSLCFKTLHWNLSHFPFQHCNFIYGERMGLKNFSKTFDRGNAFGIVLSSLAILTRSEIKESRLCSVLQ